MRRTMTLAVPAVAVAVLVSLAVWAWHSRGQTELTGTDTHEHLDDPTANAGTAAESIMVALYTWDPAVESSPWDAMNRSADRLTGRLARAAAVRPSPDPAPPQWAAWAASGDRIVGGAQVSAAQNVDGGDRVTVPVVISQTVMHSDGATTPRESMTADVDMVRDDGVWKAEFFQFRPLIEPVK